MKSMAALQIKKGGCYVVIMPNQNYNKMVLDLAKQLGGNSQTVCYVSLNRMYATLLESLQGAGVNTGNFFFIDALTLSATTKRPEGGNCVYISSVAALTELGIAINRVLKTGKFEVMVFDSLSSLLIYNQSKVVGEFIHSLVNKIKVMKVTAVFTALEEDTGTELLKKVGLSVDEIIHC